MCACVCAPRVRAPRLPGQHSQRGCERLVGWALASTTKAIAPPPAVRAANNQAGPSGRCAVHTPPAGPLPRTPRRGAACCSAAAWCRACASLRRLASGRSLLCTSSTVRSPFCACVVCVCAAPGRGSLFFPCRATLPRAAARARVVPTGRLPGADLRRPFALLPCGLTGRAWEWSGARAAFCRRAFGCCFSCVLLAASEHCCRTPRLLASRLGGVTETRFVQRSARLPDVKPPGAQHSTVVMIWPREIDLWLAMAC